ncbi:ribosomal protein S5 domain 2-type protein [Flagelloscypha sp. PMI_526]|nr:ribosomal protein S5 domain 2-type protein [Flagelloscypha sp. PMI_526]
MSGTLDTFFTSTKEPPKPIAVSQEIRDRGSAFQGYIYPASSLKEAEACISHLRNVVHASRKATHEIAAFRHMALKEGASGLNPADDFQVQACNWDDGERFGSARVLNAMAANAVLDAVVIVSRWYGGVNLGPVRFDHILTCSNEVCIAFRREEELKECKTSLSSLDAILAGLRDEYAQLLKKQNMNSDISGGPSKVVKPPDYSELDLPKAQRLVRARENAISSVKKLIAKRNGT